jgi:heme A synthase
LCAKNSTGKIAESSTPAREMMKFREMSLWHKVSIVAAVLVGGVVTRYAALVIMAGVISDLPAGLYDMTKWDEYRPENEQ